MWVIDRHKITSHTKRYPFRHALLKRNKSITPYPTAGEEISSPELNRKRGSRRNYNSVMNRDIGAKTGVQRGNAANTTS